MPKVDINARLAQRTAQESGAALDKAYNDMFGLPTGVESIVTLPLDCLHLYKDDPFKDRSGEELEQLIRSIRENGQQEPIIVRPLAEKGQYEILAGRRRRNAIQANGGTEINAVIRDVDDDTAIMIVTETNLRNREKLLPSEKAFAYKLQLEAIKRQGKDIPHIESLLGTARSFRHYHTDVYEDYVIMTDEEYLCRLEQQREAITKDILERFRTKRRNLYIAGYNLLDSINAKYRIKRVDKKNQYCDLEAAFVSDIFHELMEKGLIVTAETRNGTGFRAAKSDEIPKDKKSA